MKKVSVALLAVVAMLAFTASAFALHGTKDMFEYTPSVVKSKKAMIEIGGHIRARGEISNNTGDLRDEDDGAHADQKAAYNSRVNIGVKATVSPNTMGMIELQSNNGAFSSTSDSYNWGDCGPRGIGAYATTESNCKPADIGLRQAYIAHQSNALGMLAGFKVGHMLIGLGNGLFYNHTEFGDDAIVLWAQPADNTEVAFTIIKLTDQAATTGSADDADAYVLSGSTAMSGINLSGDVTYVQDNMAPQGDKGVTLWNVGLRGDADLSGINVSADVEFQTGSVEEGAADGDDFKLGGWALELKASTKVGDVGVHGGFAYGSGDDIDSEDSYEGFITSLSSGQRYTYLHDQKVQGAGQALGTQTAVVSSTHAGATQYGLNNTWYLNVGASMNANPDTKLSADVYYLQASQEVADDTIEGQDSKDLGVEIDGKITYQIDTNLVWYVEAGYLFAGEFYANETLDKDEIDNPWSVRHGVVLSF